MVSELGGEGALIATSNCNLVKVYARGLASRCAKVDITGRSKNRLEGAAEDLRARAEGNVLPVLGDLTGPDDSARLMERTINECGGLEHLVANPSGLPSRPVLSVAAGEDRI